VSSAEYSRSVGTVIEADTGDGADSKVGSCTPPGATISASRRPQTYVKRYVNAPVASGPSQGYSPAPPTARPVSATVGGLLGASSWYCFERQISTGRPLLLPWKLLRLV
jgi:hypothetical protein